MTRKEYMQELRDRLGRLSLAEREAALAYYEEYFDEAGPDREQEVIRALGSPSSVASRILADQAMKEARKAPYNPRKGFSALWAVLVAVCAAPFAIPVVVVLFCLLLALLSVILAVGLTAIGLVIGGIALFAGGVLGLFSNPATALVLFGIAFLLWGSGKIVFIIAGAAASLLGQSLSGLFARAKGVNHG
jgi:Predicted membrane protein